MSGFHLNDTPSTISAKVAAHDAATSADTTSTTFASGAKRSEVKPAYHLIPPVALERQAKRYAMGAEKYGILNYMVGINDPVFVRQILDHMYAHLADYTVNGCDDEDNLAAIAWGANTLMLIEQENPSIIQEIIGTRKAAIQTAVENERPTTNFYKGTPSPDGHKD